MANRWSVIGAFALLSAASQLLWVNFGGVTTVAARHYGVSESAIGWLAQVFLLVYIVLAIPAGLLLDRWFSGGLAAGAVLTAVGALVRLIGDDFGWVLFGQILVATAQPLVLNAITGVVARYLAPAQRPAGIAIGSASIFAGIMLAFLLAALLPAESQLRTLMGVSAAFSVVAALAVLAGLRIRTPHGGATPSVGLAGRHEAQRSWRAGPRAVRVALADPFVRRICTFAALPFGTFVALTTFAQALLEPAGVGADVASLILLANVVAGVLGCAVLPVWVARRGAQAAALAGGLVVTTASCVLLALAPGSVTGAVAITLIGLVLLPALPVALELIERRCGEAEGTAAGLMWLAGNLGGLIVATVIGLVVDRSTVAFLALAVVTVLGLPFVRALRPYIRALGAAGPPTALGSPTTDRSA